MTNNLNEAYFLKPLLRARLKPYILFFLFFISSFTTLAQGVENRDKIDSLIVRLSELDQSPEKVNVLNQITEIFQRIDAEKAKEYGSLSVKLARKIEYKEGKLKARLILGEIFLFYNVNVIEAFSNMNQAMELAVALDDETVQGKLLEDMGYLSNMMGDYKEAIQYYHLSLMLGENRIQVYKKLDIYGRIAKNYLALGDSSRAILYYERIKDHPDIDRLSDSSQVITMFLSDYYVMNGDYETSLKYAEKGIEIALRNEDNIWISSIYSFIGDLQFKARKFSKCD